MVMFHRHRWEMIDKTVLESAWQHMLDHANSVKTGEVKANPEFFRTKVVFVFKCSRCPKLKIVTRKNL
ncbi:MAG: hypothetical protein V2B18_25390 [Pseudomonadota bacterium]